LHNVRKLQHTAPTRQRICQIEKYCIRQNRGIKQRKQPIALFTIKQQNTQKMSNETTKTTTPTKNKIKDVTTTKVVNSETVIIKLSRTQKHKLKCLAAANNQSMTKYILSKTVQE
jgi:hypothetical protein